MAESKIHQSDVQIAIIAAASNILAGFQSATDEITVNRVKAVTRALCEGLEEGVTKARGMASQE